MSATTAPAFTTAPPAARLLGRGMVLLSLGHFTTDLFSSAVPTLQPALSERFSLSLAEAGLLGGVFMFASSVLQLPFGILSDKLRSRLFSVFGPLAAGIFLSLLSQAAGFPLLLLLAFLGGMGVAAFHPQSTSEVARLSGERKGMGMAVFITAGTFGLACGPPYFTTVIGTLGFGKLYWAVVPAVVVTALLLWKLPDRPDDAPTRSRTLALGALKEHWKPLSMHYGLVYLRSAVQLGVGQFLTLYLVRERGFTMAQASLVLALFFLAAATGSFTGGNLADRIGGKKVVLLSMAASFPFFALFLGTSGWFSLAALFFAGLSLLLTIPVNLVMAQQLAPRHAGTVSSLMMGFAWGVAGITAVPLMGLVADHTGLHSVLWAVITLPIAGFFLALALPRDASRLA